MKSAVIVFPGSNCDRDLAVALEAEVAELLGFEAALFLPSGTQSNLVGVMAHCARGDEYIVGQEAHTYRYEAGGAAVIAIFPSPAPRSSRMACGGGSDLRRVRIWVRASSSLIL